MDIIIVFLFTLIILVLIGLYYLEIVLNEEEVNAIEYIRGLLAGNSRANVDLGIFGTVYSVVILTVYLLLLSMIANRLLRITGG